MLSPLWLMPMTLLAQDSPRTIYGPPRQPVEQRSAWPELEFSASAGWATDYVFRGIEIVEPTGHEDSANARFDVKLGVGSPEGPRPFVQLFANAAESDPVSNLQTLQPTIGVDWQLRDLHVEVGHTSYFYPERQALRTNEVFAELQLTGDTDRAEGRWPIQPFILLAYDYDAFDGLYAEAGAAYVVSPGVTGLELRFEAAVAAVDQYEELFGGDGSGLQHYRLGVTAEYELNELLNIPRRNGRLGIEGRIVYTDGIENDLRADTQLWGGVGLTYRH